MAKNQVRIGVGVQDNATKPIKGIRDAFHRLQTQGGKGFAIGAGATVTAKAFDVMGGAIGFATDQIGKSINAASNLKEQMSKSNVVFGQAAYGMQQFGKTAATALGLSERAALEASSNFGAFFTGVGKSAGEAAAMSKRLVTLGADLASFNNLDPTEVLQKLQSGLSGEAEPMRALGVFLTEAKVKAKAMELGLVGAHGELSEGAKIVARYNIILAETTKAQGDFANTSQGLANQQRRNNAMIENAQARAGKVLLGLAEAAATGQAYILDEQFRREIGNASMRVQLQEKTNTELERLAAERLLTAAGTDRKAMASLILLERQNEQTYGRMSGQISGFGRTAAPAIGAVADATDDLTDAARQGALKSGALARNLRAIEEAAEDLVPALDALTASLFGADQLTGALAQAQKDLAELLKEGPESKKAQDIAIWKGAIAEARQALFDLQFQMKQTEGPAALYEWLLTVQAGLKGTDQAARDAIASLLQVTRLSSPIAPVTFVPNYIAPITRSTRPIGARATGGPASGLTMVGEQGPEIVDLPGGSNVINARDTERAMGGTTNIINLTVQGDLRARSKEDVVSALQRAAAFMR